METNVTHSLRTIRSVIFDLHAIVLIYFIPTLSHLIGFPLYYAEPMRILLIIALVYTQKNNAYILALTLPIFSFVVSAHPVFLKSLLISVELMLNVYLFYLLVKHLKSTFPAILLSIVLSKIAYYALKFALISFFLIEGDLVSTPLLMQFVITLVLSLYIFVFYKKTSIPEKQTQ